MFNFIVSSVRSFLFFLYKVQRFVSYLVAFSLGYAIHYLHLDFLDTFISLFI